MSITSSSYIGARKEIAVPNNVVAVIRESRFMGENLVMRTSVMEGRLIAYTASLLNQQNDDDQPVTSDTRYKISIDQLIKELDLNRDTAIRELKKACKSIMSKVLEYVNKQGNVVLVHALGYCEIDKQCKYIYTGFMREILPFYRNLKHGFSIYERAEFLRLTTNTQQNLFRLFYSYVRRAEYIDVPIDDLLFILQPGSGNAKNWNNTHKQMLEPAIKKINDVTNLNITYEVHKLNPDKKNSKVISVRFYLGYKAIQAKDNNKPESKSDA